MRCLIEATQLYKDYKKFGNNLFSSIFYERQKKISVIKNANFTIKGGEFCALLGKNGCGKTTMIKLLSTLLIPTRGAIYINGYDIYKLSKEARKIIGFVGSERRSFCWRLTGRQNLDFFSKLNGLSNKESRRKIDELAEIMDIRQYLDDIFYSYSAGISQRFSIARSLLHAPQIMLYDEPFRSLEPDICNRIKVFLSGLVKKKGRIVLFTALKGEDAAETSDRIFILDNGYLIEES